MNDSKTDDALMTQAVIDSIYSNVKMASCQLSEIIRRYRPAQNRGHRRPSCEKHPPALAESVPKRARRPFPLINCYFREVASEPLLRH